MTKTSSLSLVLALLLMSCNYDEDDRTRVQFQVPEPYESMDTQFTTQNAEVYFTGSSECIGSGNYRFDSDNTIDNLMIPEDLPESFDLSSELPPIGDQGRQGSCVSWATVYYLKSYQEHIESGLPYTNETLMSPAYTYNQITEGICEGTNFEPTLNILKDKGATSLESFPYLDYSCNIQPTEEQDLEAENNKISDYKYLSGENMVLEMKTLINDRMPILISAFLDPLFGVEDQYGLTAYREHSVNYSIPGGCHAMLVVGYADEYNAFKVVNSWGQGWGDDGFVWIDYAAFENVADASASFRVITSALVAYDL